MDVGLILAVVAALAVGALIGWLVAGRNSAGATQTAENLRMQLDAVTGERDEARTKLDSASRELAALQADARNFDQRMKDLAESKDALVAQFREIGDQLLDKAHKDFLEKAGQSFTKADQQSEAKLKQLLQPVEATLKRYEEGLQRVEKERVGSYEALKEQLGSIVQHNDLVRKETQRLANVMSASPKARGRWGEEQLQTILEAAGFAEHVDFKMQSTVDDDGQKLRPDCVIELPGERCIVVDVKNVWSHFEQAYDEEDQERRKTLLKQHAKAMISQANELGRKSYWRQFDRSPDFVVMFIPGEHILSAAAEREPEMISNAARNGVLIASTINMLALAKFFAGMWRQESLAAEARQVAQIGQELHRRLITMTEHIAKLGRNLGLATGAYNDFIGSLEAKVLTQAKRFEEHGIETGGKALPSLPMIDVSPRPLTKLGRIDESVEISLDDPNSPKLEQADADEDAAG